MHDPNVGQRLSRAAAGSDAAKAASPPKYFMLLGWSADKVATIRDFRHACYVTDGLDYRRGSA